MPDYKKIQKGPVVDSHKLLCDYYRQREINDRLKYNLVVNKKQVIELEKEREKIFEAEILRSYKYFDYPEFFNDHLDASISDRSSVIQRCMNWPRVEFSNILFTVMAIKKFDQEIEHLELLKTYINGSENDGYHYFLRRHLSLWAGRFFGYQEYNNLHNVKCLYDVRFFKKSVTSNIYNAFFYNKYDLESQELLENNVIENAELLYPYLEKATKQAEIEILQTSLLEYYAKIKKEVFEETNTDLSYYTKNIVLLDNLYLLHKKIAGIDVASQHQVMDKEYLYTKVGSLYCNLGWKSSIEKLENKFIQRKGIDIEFDSIEEVMKGNERVVILTRAFIKYVTNLISDWIDSNLIEKYPSNSPLHNKRIKKVFCLKDNKGKLVELNDDSLTDARSKINTDAWPV